MLQIVSRDRPQLPGCQSDSVRGRTFIYDDLSRQDHQAYCPVSILQTVYRCIGKWFDPMCDIPRLIVQRRFAVAIAHRGRMEGRMSLGVIKVLVRNWLMLRRVFPGIFHRWC